MDTDEWHDEEDEWVDEGEEDDPEDDLLVCPACGEPVHEETQQCPRCGDWIVPTYPEAAWKRTVWIVVASLLILSMALWAVL